eukprot:PhM_4_TR12523/c0_g1_i2/m.105993
MQATAEDCAYCFACVDAGLKRLPPPEVAPFPTVANRATALCALFVTFTQSRGGDLRGCIGTHTEGPLVDQLRRYSAFAAFEDRRFSPVTAHELPHLTCGVTMLSQYEPAKDCYDWVIGTHGINIEFPDPTATTTARRLYGTYLPSVMTEQGWDHRQTIDSLVRKAGYRGRVDDALTRTIQTTRFVGSKFELSYSDYVAMGKKTQH